MKHADDAAYVKEPLREAAILEAMKRGLVVRERRLSGRMIVEIDGSLLAPAAAALRDAVGAALLDGVRDIHVDLAGVPEIDAAGVGGLMDVHLAAIAVDGSLTVVNACRRVFQLLERVGVAHLLVQERAAPPVR
jgi:anti-anti-sigma regulatory factor